MERRALASGALLSPDHPSVSEGFRLERGAGECIASPSDLAAVISLRIYPWIPPHT